MHMADALLSPAVGGALWAASAGAIACCSAKVRAEGDDRKAPLMGVLGAFVFAAQMINFSIPATGSSGHLGGGLLLAILLGPWAALLAIASVLLVQALFFADGGLLALGCNIFNIGFIPALIVYPFLYKTLVGRHPARWRLQLATMVSAIVCLQLGALCVVLETLFSGISALPFATFALLMQPIHLVIGVVEGFATLAVVSFVQKARPEILQGALESRPIGNPPVRNVLLALLSAALLLGGFVSWFASENPDGLEWAIARSTGQQELESPEGGIYRAMDILQEKAALMPDYAFRRVAAGPGGEPPVEGEKRSEGRSDAATGAAGIIGGLLTLAIAFLGGFLLKRRAGTT